MEAGFGAGVEKESPVVVVTVEVAVAGAVACCFAGVADGVVALEAASVISTSLIAD